uniref:Uncharacterized protein n=1 Tax=Timema genevievae TaxID=629358 RepID=A0A7R9JUK9_TIMGE|nr:unnamed protein product [Timema genevievae]
MDSSPDIPAIGSLFYFESNARPCNHRSGSSFLPQHTTFRHNRERGDLATVNTEKAKINIFSTRPAVPSEMISGEKSILNTLNRESIPDLPIIGGLVYCESDALDNVAPKIAEPQDYYFKKISLDCTRVETISKVVSRSYSWQHCKYVYTGGIDGIARHPSEICGGVGRRVIELLSSSAILLYYPNY